MTAKKRLLGVDFGMKRTGLALTDENNIIASGWKTVPTKEVMTVIVQAVEEKNIGTIVLGDPKRLDMSDSHSSQNVRLFQEALEKQLPSIKVVLVDERFTSKMALDSLISGGVSKKKRQNKALIDEVSATIILQSYMDAQGFL